MNLGETPADLGEWVKIVRIVKIVNFNALVLALSLDPLKIICSKIKWLLYVESKILREGTFVLIHWRLSNLTKPWQA